MKRRKASIPAVLASTALATAAALAAPSIAGAQTVDGAVGAGGLAFGEYQFRLATQTNSTGFGPTYSQLDGAYVNVLADGSLQLAITGNLEGNYNPLVIFFDIGRAGAVGGPQGSRLPDGSGVFGSIPGRVTRTWGTREGANAGSVFAPGFDPARAFAINGNNDDSTRGPTNTYYTNIIDISRPGADGFTGADYYLGSNSWGQLNGPPDNRTSSGTVTATTQNFNYSYAVAGNSGTIQHAFDSRNLQVFGGGSPTGNRTGYEAIISAGALFQAPGTQTKLLIAISGNSDSNQNDRVFLSNQFLPGAAPGTSNLGFGAIGTGGSLFDYRNNPTITYLTVPTPTNVAGTAWSDGNDGTAASSWNTAYAPNGANTQATFPTSSGNRTIAVNGNITVGTISLSGPNSVAFTAAASGPSSLTFQALGNDRALFSSPTGNNTISAPVILASGLNANITTGSTVTISTVTSSATATTNSRSSGINVSGGGTLNITGNYIAGPLTVSNTAGTYNGLITLNSSNINVIRGVDANTLPDLLAAVRAFGTSGGTSGIGFLGTIPANQALAFFPNYASDTVPFYSNYAGTTLAPFDIIVRSTYIGDTNLDGVVNGVDLANVLEGLYTPGATGWQNGDFDNSGTVDLADYAAFRRVLSLNLPQLPGGPTDIGAAVTGAVPEPSSLGLLLGTGLLLSRRRR